ncbi:hypothetical protein JTE90_013784 [Oedothorax gibbosus]|uniref:Uncharacterized protein n=1 Tax=Oedothorax gibbosus TaxID=931172 RepID=A0AAV6V120_9ARAC|nr:hypothetical protein JTE90_013784 [Oedothorax gibbosus]
MKEIPKDVIEEMLSNKEIPFQNRIIDWKSFYKKWYRGKFMKRNKVSIESVQAFCANPVTCMKASGCFILTGHSNGEYYGSETLPFSHHHVISISKDSCIKIKCLLEPIVCVERDKVLNKHGDVLSSVKVFGNCFAVSCRDNTVTLWGLQIAKHMEHYLQVTLLKTIIGPQDNLLSSGFWNNKVYCVTHAGKLRVYEASINEWPEETSFKKCLASVREKRPNITAYYLFRDKIILMCSASGKLIVSIDDDNYKAYNLMETLRTLIVSVILQGTTLALGGENGRLYVFYVPTSRSLLDLDFSHPTFVFTLSEASIVSLDILYDYDSPVILASTTETLYIVKWFGKKVKIERTEATSYFENRILIE